MESRLSIRGNAVAPALLMFPLGLLAVAILCDLFHLLGGPRMVGTLGYCTMVAALAGGTAATLAGQIGELVARDPNRRPRRVPVDWLVLIVVAVILLLRMRTAERTAGPGLLMLEVMCLAMAAIPPRYRGGRTDTREVTP